MSEYNGYVFDTDFFKHRNHIFYLMGEDPEKPCTVYCLCSYSTKTKRLIIKGANEHIPPTSVLQRFIEMAEIKSKEFEVKK